MGRATKSERPVGVVRSPFSSFSSDRLDLYYAANASSPSWTFITTLTPTAAGAQTLSATYTLPAADRALALSARLDVSVLGPAEAPLARLKGRTRWHLWLRAATRKPLRSLVRTILRGDPGGAPAFQPPGVRITVDVDPVSAL